MNTATGSTRTLPEVPRRHVKAYWKGVRDYDIDLAYDTPEEEIGRQARLACQKWEARHGRRPSPKTLRTIAAVFAATGELPDVPPEHIRAFRRGLLEYHSDLADAMPAEDFNNLVTEVYQDMGGSQAAVKLKEFKNFARLLALATLLDVAGIDVSGFETPDDYMRALKDPRLEEHLDKSIKASEDQHEEAMRERRAAKQAYREWRKGRRENERKLKEAKAELERIHSERDRDLAKIDKRISDKRNEIESELRLAETEKELSDAKEEKRQAEEELRQAEEELRQAEEEKRHTEKELRKTERLKRQSEKELQEAEDALTAKKDEVSGYYIS